MDIDNTQTDARARTRQLLLRFAHAHQLPLPPELPLETIHYDGRESALALGWSQTQADAFHRRWSEAFWQGSSLSYDQGIAPIQRIARQAARAGREIFHLTGRDTSSRAATLAQLQRLRIPFAKRNHVLTKKPGESTVAFKRRQLKRLRARGYVIDYFLTDSYAEIAAVSDLDIKALLVDFPVAQRRPPKKALHALQVLSIRP